MAEVHNFEEAKAFIATENAVSIIEERVSTWIKNLKDFMAESKQVKRENDNSGPQQELEYWKRRGAQFSQLVNRLQVQFPTVVPFLLQKMKSKPCLLCVYRIMRYECHFCAFKWHARS